MHSSPTPFALSVGREAAEVEGPRYTERGDNKNNKKGSAMSFWTYLLRCADGAYYAGHTDNLDHRIAQHQSGEIDGFTHERRPVLLVYSAEFATREEALAAELRIKGWSRKKKEALIRQDWGALSALAKGKRG